MVGYAFSLPIRNQLRLVQPSSRAFIVFWAALETAAAPATETVVMPSRAFIVFWDGTYCKLHANFVLDRRNALTGIYCFLGVEKIKNVLKSWKS